MTTATRQRQTIKTLPDELNPKVEELRCANCNHFLAMEAMVEGTIAIKCRYCKSWNILNCVKIDPLAET